MRGRPAADTSRPAGARLTEAERALAESIERYRSLFTYNPHAAFSVDLEGRFTDANLVAQEVSGYTLDDFQAMDFAQIICPEHLPRCLVAFAGAVQRVPQKLEASMYHRDGHVIELNLSALPVVVEGEVVGVQGIAEDITEHNELRRELERTRRAAEEANAAKSLFLANMSHEVRTPLTSVLAATEMLREAELGRQELDLVEIIHRSGERLFRLVTDLLDFSRIEAGRVEIEQEELDLRQVVRETVASMSPLAERKDLDFRCTVDPGLPERLSGDALRITQVLTNLLENAVKFTERGAVELAVEVTGATSGETGVRFRVRDSGIGITEAHLATLFESFTQADASITRTYGGAGLGLAICHELVTLMRGTIDVQSTPGSGSTFEVTLPLRVARER